MLALLLCSALIVPLKAAAAEDRIDLVDPAVLARSLGPGDPLEVPKRLWRAGARGELIRVDGPETWRNGYYFAVTDWSSVRSDGSESSVLMTDPDLLERIKAAAAEGIQILVHNRVELSGFAAFVADEFHARVAQTLPRLRDRNWISLNGASTLYVLQHELMHQLDHDSGTAAVILDQIHGRLGDVGRATLDQIEEVYIYIIEMRAYWVEMSGILNADRTIEFEPTAEGTERTRVRRTGGPGYRARAFKLRLKFLNEIYAPRMQQLSPEIRRRVEPLLVEWLPVYPSHYERYQVRRARCEGFLRPDDAFHREAAVEIVVDPRGER